MSRWVVRRILFHKDRSTETLIILSNWVRGTSYVESIPDQYTIENDTLGVNVELKYQWEHSEIVVEIVWQVAEERTPQYW